MLEGFLLGLLTFESLWLAYLYRKEIRGLLGEWRKKQKH